MRASLLAIGEMLMRWSDDRLQSSFRRLRNPRPEEYHGPRYSLAFFCRADRDVVVQGPQRKYAPITVAGRLAQRVNANFAKYCCAQAGPESGACASCWAQSVLRPARNPP
jgi:isopenicillin N synthase-like dioxygenase